MMLDLFHIERFATHDGPGIRTTVFLKGCGMHCPWCANPESWGREAVLMHDARVCTRCGACAKACRPQAITVQAGQWHFDPSKCSRCQDCAGACLQDAICFAGMRMSTDGILAEVLKDKPYYDNSGGGLTVSGGEPLLQTAGLKELLEKAKQAGLQTAVETAGSYDSAKLVQILPYTDLILMDFKHVDRERFRQVTGGDLNLVAENFSLLAKQCPQKVIVRIPVIPGFNSGIETLKAILDQTATLGLKRADLLPYHTLAAAKWQRMDRGYPYAEHPQPLKRDLLEPLIPYGAKLGIQVSIGG